jgi:hypothetical protein
MTSFILAIVVQVVHMKKVGLRKEQRVRNGEVLCEVHDIARPNVDPIRQMPSLIQKKGIRMSKRVKMSFLRVLYCMPRRSVWVCAWWLSAALSVTKTLDLTRYPKQINTKVTQTKRKKLLSDHLPSRGRSEFLGSSTPHPRINTFGYWENRKCS